MIIDFNGGSYPERFRGWGDSRSINWYPCLREDQLMEKAKTALTMIPTPGLSLFVDLGGARCRGWFTARTLTEERCFAVVDRTLWEIRADGSSTNRGTLSNFAYGGTSKVHMELNGAGELLIANGSFAYYLTLSTNTLTVVTDADFPGCSTLAYSDGYFLVAAPDGRVHFSELNLAGTWFGDSIFTPTFRPDPVKTVVALKEEIYCFGTQTIEIYLNDGSTPFIRRQGSTLSYGILAPQSAASCFSGIFFLGKSGLGDAAVYMIGVDYAIRKIAPPANNNFISLANGNLEDCEGFVQYSPDGHIWYMLHVPALDTTFVYDQTTQMWHERSSRQPYFDANGDKPWGIFRGRGYTSFKGLNLFFDRFSGKVFKEDYNVQTEDSEIIKRTRRSGVFYEDMRFIGVHALEFDMNVGNGATSGQGSSPRLMVRYSKDGGNTYSAERLLDIRKLGHYGQRARMNKLGTGRHWVVEITLTDPVPVSIFSVSTNGVISGVSKEDGQPG